MKSLATLLFIITICLDIKGQPGFQFRVKTGFAQQYHSGVTKGFAFQRETGGTGSLVIGAELSKSWKNKKGAFLLGFSFTDEDGNIIPNTKNLNPENLSAGNNYSFVFSGGPARTFVYAGLERYLNKEGGSVSKNYFSFAAGAGITFTLNQLTNWTTSYPANYQTWNGESVQGLSMTYDRGRIAPTLYGAIRYHVRNAKGKEVLIMELSAHSALSTFYQQRIQYTLNGQPKTDILKERGNSIEFNLIFPLFGRRN